MTTGHDGDIAAMSFARDEESVIVLVGFGAGGPERVWWAIQAATAE